VTNVHRSRGDIGRRSIILGIFARSNLRLRPVLQATLTLTGGLRSPFRLSLALIGFALPLE
jgi:hypothetical protein